jgi:hypothetical protein
MIPWDFARFAHPRFVRIRDLVARLAAAGDWPSIAMLNDCYRAELGCAGVRLVEAGKNRPALGADSR